MIAFARELETIREEVECKKQLLDVNRKLKQKEVR